MSFNSTANSKKSPNSKNAWVVLLMIDENYVKGALVVAQTLRNMKTKHDIVCMVTNDISDNIRSILLETSLYDFVIEVPYIEQATRPFRSPKQLDMYSDWIDRSFTKWNCLTLTQYDRVILLDADMLLIANCDDLFDLKAPAACYSNPWGIPYGTLKNPYLSDNLQHGAIISEQQIKSALTLSTFVGWGTMILLEPNKENYDAFIKMIHAKKVFGMEYNAISGSDEISIALFYAATGWTHIHQKYVAIPWKKHWVSKDIRAYHYHGHKPWLMKPDEWPDLADWWTIVKQIKLLHPELCKLFGKI
jgi:hypothetical protein